MSEFSQPAPDSESEPQVTRIEYESRPAKKPRIWPLRKLEQEPQPPTVPSTPLPKLVNRNTDLELSEQKTHMPGPMEKATGTMSISPSPVWGCPSKGRIMDGLHFHYSRKCITCGEKLPNDTGCAIYGPLPPENLSEQTLNDMDDMPDSQLPCEMCGFYECGCLGGSLDAADPYVARWRLHVRRGGTRPVLSDLQEAHGGGGSGPVHQPLGVLKCSFKLFVQARKQPRLHVSEHASTFSRPYLINSCRKNNFAGLVLVKQFELPLARCGASN